MGTLSQDYGTCVWAVIILPNRMEPVHTILLNEWPANTALCIELLKLLGVILVLMLVYILVEVQT